MYIIYDLEHLVSRSKQDSSSIIEIGAIKIDFNLTIVDHFHSYVRPKYFQQKYAKTFKITGIPIDKLNEAPTFEDVLRIFKHWISIDSDIYYLCSWGNDIQIFIDDCVKNSYDSEWMQNYNDIQRKISPLLNTEKNNPISLIAAVRYLFNEQQFEFEQHSAISDAWFTSLIFLEFFDKIQLEKNSINRMSMFSRKFYKDEDIFKNNPFGKLSKFINTTD